MSARSTRSWFSAPIHTATAALVVCSLAMPGTPSGAAPRTPAGTTIPNTARVSHGGVSGATATSNTVSLTIAELLDVAIVADQTTIEVAADADLVPVGFRVTNEGNATETFALAAAGGAIAGIAADDDGDKLYDPKNDRLVADPAVELKAGASRRFFVLVRDLPASGMRQTITATATAITGHGAFGTVFAGAGLGGVDAVVGRTTAEASARTIIVGGVGQPRLEKSSTVRASNGSGKVMPGAVVTWQLTALFPRATSGAVVEDAIPAGTRFVAGSITLDGRALTDAADTDAGRFDGATIQVSLGTIAAAGTRTIRFQTIIQ